MSAILVFCFLVILATLLFAIGGGLRWYEARRRRQLVGMLRTVSTSGAQPHVDLLIDPNQKKAGLDSLLGEGGIANRLTRALAESGLDWTITRLLTTAAVAMAVGFLAGLIAPAPLAPAAR